MKRPALPLTAGRRRAQQREGGFTLIEILVSLLVASIGLLGLLGMQTMALNSTQVASIRSLVALQASSLAAAMHSNTAYWVAGTASSSFQMSGSGVKDSSNQLSAIVSTCNFTSMPVSGQCLPMQLAAFDVQSWAANMQNLLPTYAASVECSTDPAQPLSCKLDITWNERYVALGGTPQSNSNATAGQRNFTLFIQP